MKKADQLRAVIDALLEGGVPRARIDHDGAGRDRPDRGTRPRDLPGEFQLGAGTVLDPETARQVILAGAKYIVAPTLNLDMITMCHRYDVAVMPGCFTPTEILTAWQAGADV